MLPLLLLVAAKTEAACGASDGARTLRDDTAWLRAAGAAGCVKTDDTKAVLHGQDYTPAAERTTNNITHFSWYSGPSERPGSAYTNLAMHGNLTFLQRSYQELGVPGMLRLDQSKWGTVEDGSTPWIRATHPVFGKGNAGLTTTWEAAVDDCIAAVTPLAKGNGGYVHGIQLGDELVCGGFPLSNLSALSARLHAGLHQHGVFIFTNECFNQGAACKTDRDCGPPTRGSNSGGGHPVCMRAGPGVVFPGCQAAVWQEIPAGLDAVSLDIYFQFPERLPNGSYFGGGGTEVAWAKAFYTKYFLPFLKPHQSVWLVPGLFGSNASSAGGFGPTGTVVNSSAMMATDDELVEKLSDYWSWADTEPRITGMIPWHWHDYPVSISIPTMRWGAEAYPKTLAWIKSKVSRLQG